MHFTTSAVRTVLTASRRYALMAGVCAATMGLVACGSDTSKDTKTTGTTTGSATGSTTGSTTGTTTAGATTGSTTGATTTDCSPSGNASFTGTQSGVTFTPTGGTAVNMPYAIFRYSASATDANKKWVLSVFDYDYCAFSYDHGYSYWPIDGFHAASFDVVSAANSNTSFNATTYTLNSTTTPADDFVYLNAAKPYGSGMTITTAGAGGAQCTGITYPTLDSGTIKFTTGPSTISSNAMSGVVGDINITTSLGTISGTFTTGTCSASNATPPTVIDACSCSL